MSVISKNTIIIRNFYTHLKNIRLAAYGFTLRKHDALNSLSIAFNRTNRTQGFMLVPLGKQTLQPLSSQASKVENMQKIPFPLADIGEGITEVEILRWFVKDGQQVKQFDKICEVQSDKATVEITSRYDGVVRDVQYKEGDIAKVGKPLCFIESIAAETMRHVPETIEMSPLANIEKDKENAEVMRDFEKVLATPAVRRIAREHKIDLSKVPGSGSNGRVLKEDILAYIEKQQVPLKEESSSGVSSQEEQRRIEPIRGLRRAMTKTMTASLSVPQLTLGEEVVMDRLIDIRSGLKSTAEKLGVRLTYMPFFIKATSYCLSRFPILNSSVDANYENIIYHRHHNISIAMDTPVGLTVPNIKYVDQKSILEVAKDLQVLMDLAEAGRLGEEQLKDGTFSISNVGVISGTYTAPVVFVPQVAIGAFGRTRMIPVVDSNGHVKTAHVITVSWSADHRIIDGATIARFSKLWKSCIEEPEQLLLYFK
ncbi:Lipoamide acyltransferase component of branched-chain alpha-keto acid dehydrogenase complex, mitochondrial [Galdieria sulphuraria]|nr:Lipoamide acyltransferase component of branched-chain alpha-keto acid dehydrogenase complex, mitochondrial [Galdieria sulphuraria]